MSVIFIEGDTKAVWEALTKEEQLTKWVVPGSPWQVHSLSEGEKVVLTVPAKDPNESKEEKTITFTIRSIIPFQELSVYMNEQHLTLTFELTEADNGTRITVNLSSYDHSLANLKALIEGRPLPYA